MAQVRWIDSHSDTGGWTELSEVERYAELTPCHTVGWQLHRDEEKIVIAHTLTEDEACGVLVIPVFAIISVLYANAV